MREKKMGMRRLAACVLAAALTLGGAATTLATPAVAEAATTADIPSNVKIAQTESKNPTLPTR